MKLKVQSVLAISSENAWQRLLDPGHLEAISAPLVRFSGPKPVKWEAGQTYSLQISVMGLPWGHAHEIEFEKISPETRTMQTAEKGGLVRRWEHRFSVTPQGPDHCLYVDALEIDAGWNTWAVFLFAHVLYRHRHRRWARQIRRQNTKA